MDEPRPADGGQVGRDRQVWPGGDHAPGPSGAPRWVPFGWASRVRRVKLAEHTDPYAGLGVPELYEALLEGRAGPRWPNETVQRMYVGNNGVSLLRQSLEFLRMLDEDGAFPPGWRGLDYGCGFGRFATLLLSKGNPEQLDMCDAWEKTLSILADLGHRNRVFRVSELLRPGELDQATYDVILAFSVFTHLSPAAYEANLPVLADALKPGGRFYFTVWHDEFIDHKYADRSVEMREALNRDGMMFTDSGGNFGTAKVFGHTVVTSGWLERFAPEGFALRYLGPVAHTLQHVYALERRSENVTPPRSRNLVPPVELIAANNIGIHDKENILGEYDRVGVFITTMLKNRAGMRPDSDVLDVGCGTGRVAKPLTEYLTTGNYAGIDVVLSSVEWCRDAFAAFPNFRFIHADLYSEFYNSGAAATADDYRFPFDDESFDVVFSASLFTHLLMPAVDNYLKEMARVLRPGGSVWNSYLLLDEVSEPLVLGPRSDGRRMQYEVEGGRVGYKDKPEHVVGLRKDRVLALHEKHGLGEVDVLLSNWSGGRTGKKYRGQDIIIARKG